MRNLLLLLTLSLLQLVNVSAQDESPGSEPPRRESPRGGIGGPIELGPDDKPATVRAQIMRAAKLADVELAVKKSADGFYFGLMTPQRKSRRGRPRKDAGAE